MSDPIVVGADGSAPSEHAVAWAADEAARYKRGLKIVHAIEKWPFDIPLTLAPGEAGSLSRRGGEVLAGAERVAHARRPEVPVSVELASGRTVQVLAEQSRESFELVVGHRGLGGFAGLLLGSVGLGVVRSAASPVVLVRGEPRPTGRRSPWASASETIPRPWSTRSGPPRRATPGCGSCTPGGSPRRWRSPEREPT
jgi:nucleotide-binding universal stress UspA family protein